MKEEDTASLKTFNMNTKMISHLEEKKIITATRVQVEIFKLFLESCWIPAISTILCYELVETKNIILHLSII